MPTLQAQQEFLNYNPECPDWVAVKVLLEEVDEEIVARREYVLYRLSAWLMALRIFRRVEERKLILDAPSSRDLDHHRAFLTLLLGQGEVLLLDLRRHDEVDIRLVGLDFADAAAYVEELRMDLRSRYGGMTDAGRRQVLDEVFGLEE